MDGEMFLALGCGATLVLMGLIAYRAVKADYLAARSAGQQVEKNK